MAIVHFITHPEVSIDAAVPVPDWPLSPVGRRRMQAAMRRPWLAGVRSVFCSAERKATDAAGIVAVQGDTLDRAYLQHWGVALGLQADLARLLSGEIRPKHT